MSEPVILCPNCKTEIELTKSLAAPFVESTRKQYELVLAQKDKDINAREAALALQREEVTKEKETIDQQVATKLKNERERIAEEEYSKARNALSFDIEKKSKENQDLQSLLKEREGKLEEAAKAQTDYIRKQRELDDAKREIDLTVEKRVEASLGNVRDQAKKEGADEQKLKLLEQEKTMSSMRQQIEELKRRSEQGSQQLQGEVQELELESILRERFTQDSIEPVPKGEHGGDILHRVMSPRGQLCGTILWEAKRTKSWSDGWLPKLRDDQRAAKAEIALIVSHVLPKNTDTFEFISGVWVAKPKYTVPLAMALRYSLIELAGARQSNAGQQTKTEILYQYLTGSRFRQRIEAIVEKFSDMREDLDKERKTMTKAWAKREVQISGVMESVAGMYGDMQGIAGKTLKEIEGLNLTLEGDDSVGDAPILSIG